jgi:hypothetical protein
MVGSHSVTPARAQHRPRRLQDHLRGENACIHCTPRVCVRVCAARCRSQFFVARVRANLHVVLSMDPAHPEFVLRCESNPAIFNQCAVLWMGQWTPAALEFIPARRFRRLLQGWRWPASLGRG